MSDCQTKDFKSPNSNSKSLLGDPEGLMGIAFEELSTVLMWQHDTAIPKDSPNNDAH